MLNSSNLHEEKQSLVAYKKTETWRYATGYYVDEEALASTVAKLQLLSDEELKAIGEKNREAFLRREKEFKDNLSRLFPRKQPVATSMEEALIEKLKSDAAASCYSFLIGHVY